MTRLRLVDNATTAALPLACNRCGQITPALGLVVAMTDDSAHLVVHNDQLEIRDNHTCKETTS